MKLLLLLLAALTFTNAVPTCEDCKEAVGRFKILRKSKHLNKINGALDEQKLATCSVPLFYYFCLFVSGRFKRWLVDPAIVEREMARVIAAICPSQENPDGCEEFVHTYWPGMNGPMTDFFLGDEDAACAEQCTGLGTVHKLGLGTVHKLWLGTVHKL